MLQGSGKVRGHIIPVCGGPLHQIMGTKFFPTADCWEGAIIALEHVNVYDSRETLFKVILKEVHRPDMVIVENFDFIHRTPMTVIPVGAKMEIDCNNPKIEILEPGVS